jgi:hypothetical protein
MQYRANDANMAISNGLTLAQKPVAAAITIAARQISETNLKYFIEAIRRKRKEPLENQQAT